MQYRVRHKNGDTIVEGVNDFNLESTLECGQCFRWEKNKTNDYTGVAFSKALRIIQDEDTLILKDTPISDYESIWHEYFDLGTDYAEIKNALSQNDSVMEEAIRFAPGIRILRQEFFETLVSFIISANNSIPNIKRVIAALSKRWGAPIFYSGKEYHSFPEPGVLAKSDICDLQLTKAGYRCEYIKKTAGMYADNPYTPDDISIMGYEEGKRKLMEYMGVGAKVADCTILFTGAHIRAFPVDIWIKKIMESLYIKKETPVSKIAEIAYERFGDLSGYAQQYLFHFARINKI
jgi:N-glycosylase/DNA lyase